MASAAVNKTVDELKTEIAELYRQNREINERLNNRGRRLGRGGPIARGGRGKTRKADYDLDGPPTKKLSSVVIVNGDDEGGEAGAQAGTGTRSSSLISPRGRRRDFHGYEKSDVPRVVPKVDDPKLAKRNRRMFGALLGTLEKFREEEMSNTEVVMRRSDSVKKAVQKAQEESDKLRQQERESFTEKRKRDLMLRAKITAKAEGKQIELLYMQWTSHRTRLSTFLKTKTEPCILYLPAKQTERDRQQLEEQQKDLDDWKVKCRQELDEYHKQLTDTYLAKAQADIDKVGVGRNRRRAQLEAEAAEKEAATNDDNEQEEEQEPQEQAEQNQDENDALVADVMDEEDDYRPEDDMKIHL